MDGRKVSFNELVSNLITEADRLGFSGSYIWRSLVIGCGAVQIPTVSDEELLKQLYGL